MNLKLLMPLWRAAADRGEGGVVHFVADFGWTLVYTVDVCTCTLCNIYTYTVSLQVGTKHMNDN